MGTDSALTYVTHYNVWREMDLLVRYSRLTSAQALSRKREVRPDNAIQWRMLSDAYQFGAAV